ncbi:hypothetical protein H8D30_05745, partial [bacterium]|nr:hypothetical protein [bacterium]
MPILFLLLALLLPESSSPYPAVPFRLEETLSALWGESVLESTYILEGLLWFDQDGLYLSLTSFSPKGGKKSVFDPPLSTSLSFPDLSMEEASEEIVENDPSKPPLEEELSGERRDDPDKSLENEEDEKVVEPDPSKPSLEEELSEERRDDPDKSLENEEDEKVV